jgi:ParB family transcriptional regulator, chromosome partitioning protein
MTMATVARLKPKNAPSDAGDAELRTIPVDKIDPNPDNPRVIFRQGELEQLLESVALYGIQVPISVYREGGRYVLIDGERRWKVSQKLNRRDIPALIQQKPSALANLLLMFNIHALREQWDLLTVAMKLPKIIDLLRDELGYEPKEPELAERTGIPRAWIRRSKLLMEMPQQYRDMLMEELGKPKHQQLLSEDFFIEMERGLRTVERTMPQVIPNKDRVRRVLIDKYRKGTIGNVVHFRKIGKIARARVVEADEQKAEASLAQLFERNDYSIERAFGDSVSEAYLERDVLTGIDGLISKLGRVEPEDVDDEMKARLRALIATAQKLLESAE